jgi:hypothetical protein
MLKPSGAPVALTVASPNGRIRAPKYPFLPLLKHLITPCSCTPRDLQGVVASRLRHGFDSRLGHQKKPTRVFGWVFLICVSCDINAVLRILHELEILEIEIVVITRCTDCAEDLNSPDQIRRVHRKGVRKGFFTAGERGLSLKVSRVLTAVLADQDRHLAVGVSADLEGQRVAFAIDQRQSRLVQLHVPVVRGI